MKLETSDVPDELDRTGAVDDEFAKMKAELGSGSPAGQLEQGDAPAGEERHS
jgi:hypothetical protein